MKYIIFVKATKESEAGVMPGEEMISRMATYHEQLAKAGIMVDASGIQATSKGWRIRYDGDKRTVVEGPFTDTRDLVSGYTIINVKSKEEALDWTKRYPNPTPDDRGVEIEVRRLFELKDFEEGEAVDRFRKLAANRGK